MTAAQPLDKITSILTVVEESASGALVLDKAVRVARSFGARIDLLVADSLLTPEFATRCAALDYDDVTLCSLFRSGEPLHELLLRRVRERRPDLLVKAPAGEQSVSRWTLHPDDAGLARESPVPLLLARMRPWSEALRFATAVDVSESEAAVNARGALQAAGFLALGCQGTLDILYSEAEEHDETVRMERAVRLAQLAREFHVGCERLQMFGGRPESRLPPLIAARHYDVLVLGIDGHRRPGLTCMNLTARLAEATAGDVLLVAVPVAPRAELRRGAFSSGQQTAHQREQLV